MKYGYSVMTANTKIPVLIRFANGQVETFDPTVEGEWRRSPSKDKILYGGGDFVWYDDITEADVPRFQKIIRKLTSEAGNENE